MELDTRHYRIIMFSLRMLFSTVGSSHRVGKVEGGGIKTAPTVDSPFTTHSDKPVHAKAHTQDTVDLASARPGAFRTSNDVKPLKIADNKKDTDVQKLFSNENNKPVGFSASGIAVALLSLAAMVGVR